MPKFVYEKMGIIKSQQVLVIDGPDSSVETIRIPGEVDFEPRSQTDYDHIILFRIKKENLEVDFPVFKHLLHKTGKLWIAWPKAKKLETDLNTKEVIRIGYSYGLVESTNLRIDDTWTALNFTHPKPGKVYNNSYGTLPE